MERYRAYLFDLDGTLYRGDEPMPHASAVLDELRSQSAFISFLTNNSGTTPALVAEKLRRMAIQAKPEEVVTSGMAAARHCTKMGYDKLFVIGEKGLVDILRKQGLTVANADGDGNIRPDERGPYDAVLCGICRRFTYDLLNSALQALRGGAAFVATNPDATYPMEKGRIEPGAGSLVAALQTCAGVEPYVAGKPHPDMIQLALEQYSVAPSEALVVGDRMDTDIAAAKAACCPSVLILGGVTEAEPEGVHVIRDLRELLG